MISLDELKKMDPSKPVMLTEAVSFERLHQPLNMTVYGPVMPGTISVETAILAVKADPANAAKLERIAPPVTKADK